MKIINIKTVDNNEALQYLNIYLKGTIKESFNEKILTFDNEFGIGTIRSIGFDFGVSLLDYNVNFVDDVKIVFQIIEESPIEFLFISEGSLEYSADKEKNVVVLNQYQNVIISNKTNASNTFVFPKKVSVKVNVIKLVKKEFNKKKNNNSNHLQKSILSIFRGEGSDKAFQHLGNYNLKIADHVKQLNNSPDDGLIKSLSIEGQLNLILALQLLEHKKHENRQLLPDSISKEDIKKIHKLSEFILDNISGNISIESLVRESGMNPKKLQIGFRLLFNKSINEYIRQLKMELARDFIKNTDFSISEIVYQIGYRSRSYFSKVFFEYYGILPTNYRESIKNKSRSN